MYSQQLLVLILCFKLRNGNIPFRYHDNSYLNFLNCSCKTKNPHRSGVFPSKKWFSLNDLHSRRYHDRLHRTVEYITIRDTCETAWLYNERWLIDRFFVHYMLYSTYRDNDIVNNSNVDAIRQKSHQLTYTKTTSDNQFVINTTI